MNKKILIILISFLFIFFCNPLDDGIKKILVSYERLNDSPITPILIIIVMELFGADPGNVIKKLLDYSVDIYRIVYTTQYKGKKVNASGLCLLPAGNFSNNPLPVLGYQHGTIFQEKNIPSNYQSIFSLGAETGLNMIFASCGFISFMPDYLGYGESRHLTHPYIIKEYTAKACLDMLYAVEEFCEAESISMNRDLFLTGYSEGGYATIAFLELLQNTGDLNFKIQAVSSGAGIYRIFDTARLIINKNNLNSPAFYAFVLYSYFKIYRWQRNLGEIFLEPYLSSIKDGLFNGDYSLTEINGKLTGDINKLNTAKFLSDYRGSGEWDYKNAFLENDIGTDFFTNYPLKLFHGDGDLTVPSFNSQKLFDIIKKNGSAPNCQLIILSGKDHSGAIEPWVRQTISWFCQIR